MTQILRAPEAFGPTITAGVYANHVVVETRNKPKPLEKRWHWCVMTPDATWQVGWALTHGVQIQPDSDGHEPSEKAVKYYRDVAAGLAAMYGGEHVETYRNPGYRPNRADITTRKATTLQKIVPRAISRAYGARSTSEAKASASRKNLSGINTDRQQEGEARVERYQSLKAGGMTFREIAEREGVTVNAVECVLKRARRLEAARQAAKATHTDELAQRRAARAAREEHLNAAQKLAIYDKATDDKVVVLPDGSIEIKWADGSGERVIPGGQRSQEDYLPTGTLTFLRTYDALHPDKYVMVDGEVLLTDHPGLRHRLA